MERKSNATVSGGLGFWSVLGLMFVVLKLTGAIDWSWLWVLSPFWLPIVLTLGVVVLIVAVVGIVVAIQGLIRFFKENDD